MTINNVSQESSRNELFGLSNKNGNYSSIMTIFRISLVLILRAGFVSIQFGSIPTESFYDLLLQNVVEFTVSIASYGLVGSLLSFGSKSFGGLSGYGPWDHLALDLDNVLLGFCAVIIGSAIITTFLSSRLHLVGTMVIAFVYGGILQPILMHWMWHQNGWMNNAKFINQSLTISDHGGSLVIHTSSGLVGLIGVSFLGRRLLRLNDVDDCSLGAEAPSLILTGYVCITVGLIGFSLPSKVPDAFHDYNYIGVILVNDLLAMAGGSTAAIILEFILWKEILNYWAILRCMQASISGLVIISASVDICSPPLAFGITIIASILLNIVSKLIYKSSVEDYCNIITTHLLSGIWSCVLEPIVTKFSYRNATISPSEVLIKVLWHTICIVTLIFITSLIFSLVFLLLSCAGFLRNKTEENCHRRSVKLSKKYEECPLNRLFVLSNSDSMIEPGSSGKIPDYSTSENQISVAKTISSNLGSKLPSERGKSEGQLDPMASAVLSVTERKCKSVPNSSINKTRKAKNIYTIQNLVQNPQNENMFCCGDTEELSEIYKLEDLMNGRNLKDNSNRLKCRSKLITRRKSHHKLNKCKRYVDFSKKKTKKKVSFTDDKNTGVSVRCGQNLSAYDKRYDDGVTTVKEPLDKCILNRSKQ